MFFSRFSRTFVLIAGAGILLTLSLVSHAAATAEIRTAAIFNDYVHLLAAAFWVGGLFHFALAIPHLIRTLSGAERQKVLAALVPRFSTLATLSVGTLIITGLYSAWAQVTILPALATPYGLTLLVKVALIIPLLLLGALNLLWVSPRLAREEQAGRWLRRFITGEAVLAILVLLSVGLLVVLEPARQVASREGIGQDRDLIFQDMAEGATINLNIEPGQVGPNNFFVSLEDRFGNPIVNASDVSLDLNYLGADLGENTVSAISIGDGQHGAEGVLLSMAGPWQVELVVRRPDAFDARTAFRFEVTGGTVSSAAIAPSPEMGQLLWSGELILLGFLFVGVGIPVGSWRTRRGAIVTFPGVIAVLAGIFLAVTIQFTEPEVQGAITRNPFPPNPASLAIGQQVYEQSCQSCHVSPGKATAPRELD